GGYKMLPAASALAEQVHFFHNGVLMPIITVISLVILGLLIWVVLRYNSKANPTPRKFSHNTMIEVVWTAVPIIILLFIALFSFDLLYSEDVVPDGKQVAARGDGATTEFSIANDFPASRMATRPDHVQVFVNGAALKRGQDYTLDGLGDATVNVTMASAPAPGAQVVLRAGRSSVNASDCPAMNRLLGNCPVHIALAPTMTLKVIGFQWGWTYSYPDFGDFEFTANMVEEDLTKPGKRYEVDNPIYVPVGETVRVVATARDVIHAWALPNMALKIDAVPGRINEIWFEAEREGVFHGQCSEICGVRHAFMPIAVHVVSRPEFEAWVDSQRELAGMAPMFGDQSTDKFAQAATEE
ncbi:MAG: hypothetical protein KDA46_04135, partial [Parvularculaceae bacterium]|nr:hypothetical protein [Parvularculaceae bacterium]